MKILKGTSSPLLFRKTVEALIDHKGKVTPSTSSVKKSLAEHLSVPEEVISISHIYSLFGSSESKVIANIYKDKEALEKIEIKKKKPKAKKQKSQGAPQK